MDHRVTTLGFASLLEGDAVNEVKRLRRLLERKYRAKPLQGFIPPHVSFQGIRNDYGLVATRLAELVGQMSPFDIEINGIGHFDQKVIYLNVRKTDALSGIYTLVNAFLASHGDPLGEYAPQKLGASRDPVYGRVAGSQL